MEHRCRFRFNVGLDRRAKRNSFLAPILVPSSRPKLPAHLLLLKSSVISGQRAAKIVSSAPTRMSARGRSQSSSELRRDYENGGRKRRSRSRMIVRRCKGSAGRAASLVSPGPPARPCPAGRHARWGGCFQRALARPELTVRRRVEVSSLQPIGRKQARLMNLPPSSASTVRGSSRGHWRAWPPP